MSVNRRKFLITTSALFLTSLPAICYWPNRWRYIVVHHSAGDYGNIPFLQQVHRQRQARDPIDAIPYHFVIGNGNGLGLGEVASDWRQQYNVWGSHVSRKNFDRNWFGLGICMVGNFEQHPVPSQQYQSLVTLTRQLMHQFDIDVKNVSGHGHIIGESTLCPGRHFPLAKFLQDIA